MASHSQAGKGGSDAKQPATSKPKKPGKVESHWSRREADGREDPAPEGDGHPGHLLREEKE
jgi:hypothetical protein